MTRTFPYDFPEIDHKYFGDRGKNIMIKNKVAAVIQARMNSSRLPGKVLLPLAGKSALQCMIERVQRAEGIDQIIVATPHSTINFLIWDLCEDMGISIFCGSENDVLSRVLDTAHFFNVDIIVDLTADCPIVDHRHITQLVKTVKRGVKPWRRTVDYASNIYPKRSWPDGFDVQVYKTRALRKAKQWFAPPHHVGWNIAQYPESFRLDNKGLPAPLWLWWPDLRLTLDTRQDYVVLDKIFNHFGDKDFTAEDAIMLMRQKLEWQEINKDVRTKTPEEG